ncbi:hypothetical protein GCM10027280_35410 [Micromonospora polyrhachis]|uniref:Uncharacterized protein n=1 Tax=Micromonospora polyrhachis TaxID=1282883 RepID=A0A7W7SQT1_9ACTN|nr:hypothetical protein [Micromonospora polyrhachis]MBB4958856.1 hypothetical protein [Micromonospora polyrhachis]
MTRLMAVLGLVAALFLVAAPAPAQAAEEGTGKYYVVGPPVNGQREYLFAIAATTLGDGRRYMEIFELNEGRLQPDGQRMTSPTTVEPGWLLALPKDAKGSGVVSGPLPTVSPTSVQPSPSTDATTSSLRPSGGLADDGGSTAALSRLWTSAELWLAVLALAVLMLLGGPLTLRSRRSHRLATVPAQQPGSAHESAPAATATPTIVGAKQAVSETLSTATVSTAATATATTSAGRKGPVPAPPGTSTSAAGSAMTVPATAVAPAAPAAGSGATEKAATEKAATEKAATEKAATEKAATEKAADGSAATEKAVTEKAAYAALRVASPTIAISLPALAAGRDASAGGHEAPSSPNWFPILDAELTCGSERATVRLIGTRALRWGSAYGWLGPQDEPPPSGVPLVLGEHQERRLWVDLALAPDALTIGGDPAAVRRQGAALLTQLRRSGADVVVAGDVLGETLPAGVRRIAAVADLAADRPVAGIRVLVCAPAEVAALRRVRRSARPSQEHLVPVVIGDGPAARWSLRLGEPAAAASAAATASVEQ